MEHVFAQNFMTKTHYLHSLQQAVKLPASVAGWRWGFESHRMGGELVSSSAVTCIEISNTIQFSH